MLGNDYRCWQWSATVGNGQRRSGTTSNAKRPSATVRDDQRRIPTSIKCVAIWIYCGLKSCHIYRMKTVTKYTKSPIHFDGFQPERLLKWFSFLLACNVFRRIFIRRLDRTQACSFCALYTTCKRT